MPTRMPDPAARSIGGPLRWGLGALLLAAATAVLLVGGGLEYGVGWTAVVPAALLLLPAGQLLRRIRLRIAAGRIEVEQGWLFRRCWALPLAGAELELMPTAGLRAVLLHSAGRATPLATWVRPATAEALAAWLDAHAPDGPLARRTTAPPAGDY